MERHAFGLTGGIANRDLIRGAGKGKVLVFAGVPKDLSTKLNAGQWLNAALAPLGGRGGGKPVAAQGSGPKVPTSSCIYSRFHSCKTSSCLRDAQTFDRLVAAFQITC